MELNKKNIKRILFIACFVLLVHWGLNHTAVVAEMLGEFAAIISPFLLGACFAFVINVLLRPVESGWDKIWKKSSSARVKKFKRPVCICVSTLLIAGGIFVVLFMVVPQIQRTVSTMLDMLPQYMVQIETWWAELSAALQPYNVVLPQPEFNLPEVGKMIANFLSESGSVFFSKTVDITASIFTGVFNVVLGLVFAFYLLSQKETLGMQAKNVLLAVLPQERVKKIAAFFELTNQTFTKFVVGQLTEAFIIGGLCFAGMMLFGMPYAPMVSVLVGFTALIPVFGAFFGTAVGAFLILMVNPVKALWFILFIVVLQQLEGNLIYPKVVGKSVGLPGIWVLTAVTVGGAAFGMLGMILSVPVCSVLYSVTRQTVNESLERKGIKRIEK